MKPASLSGYLYLDPPHLPAQLADLIKEINALPEPRIPLRFHWDAFVAQLGIFWTGRKLNGAF